ncbi:sulfite exporter TauE/SafE family protein [Leptolyngbya sp. FACHB-261]|uniref:sulfite exporter TauE/SafE family protein n=1 Tax=Leptolyngbya sp. FACHB-261 TaxID=2692806 RepID=UPI00168492BE|nr:sulfite exporter TauE/SafE family protein [Leptolyngbya sp. FACHB-261]MBD2102868.1 sulfite exporter TauE/SafE family protein [Leptolyngbya sp. FACHB-261]
MDLSELLNPGLFALLLLGTIVGILSALLGIGGGLLMVPALTVWGASPLQAVATSLVGVVLGSASGSLQNWRRAQLNLERVVLLAPPAMLTTELGVWLANTLPAGVLLLSFAALQVLTIFLMDFKQRLQKLPKISDPLTLTTTPVVSNQSFQSSVASGGVGLMQAVSSDPEMAETQIYQSQGIGLLAGVLSGLFGVGGGVVMVPLQMLFLGEGIKDAVRTSLGAVTLISLWAVGRHAAAGSVLWLPGLYLGLGSLCGAQLGARLLPKLPDAVVGWLFRGLLLLLATYMTLKALSG